MENKKSSAVVPVSSPPRTDLVGRELSNAMIFFHEAVASHLGMGAAEWKCLGLLDQHGPLTASRLAELSGFTTGAITGIVDRLERAGYARRAPHPSDRRSVVVQPRRLRELKEQVAPIFQSLGRAMGEIARHYNAAELAAIGKFFRQTTEVLRNETAKLRSQKQRRTPGNR
jgi:DNA-binding MarR family transcriptional regulator